MATNSEVRRDFLLDKDGDFPLEDNVVNGEYLPTQYGDSDDQHKVDCIFYTKGSLKQFPTSGFGLITYQESEYDADNVYTNLSKQMKDDGYKTNNGSVYPDDNNGFSIDTNMISNIY